MEFDYKQLHFNEELYNEPWVVKGYKDDGYPKGSVCEGMTLVRFIDSYKTKEEALKEHLELYDSEGLVQFGHEHFDSILKDCSHISDSDTYPVSEK